MDTSGGRRSENSGIEFLELTANLDRCAMLDFLDRTDKSDRANRTNRILG